MSDIVFVAVIGVVGTLLGSIFAPIIKDRVDRSSRTRDANREELRGRILAISQTLTQMVQLEDSDRQEWSRMHAQLNGEVAVFGLLLSKGEGGLSGMVEVAAMFSRRGSTAVERSLHPLVVAAAVSMLSQWYRGERKAKGMPQQLIEIWSMNREGLVDGTILPGGEPIPESELTEDERAERSAKNKQGRSGA